MSYDPNVSPPRGDGGNRTLYFIVGGLVVLAGVFVFVFTNNDFGGRAPDTEVNVGAPAAEPAAPPPAAEPAQPAPAPQGGTTTTQ
jgi:hypothetical protein